MDTAEVALHGAAEVRAGLVRPGVGLGGRLVDGACVLLSAIAGLATFAAYGLVDPVAAAADRFVDLGLGLTACSLLWLRRTHPVAVAVLTLPAAALATSAAPAIALITFSTAARRPLPVAVGLAAVQVAAAAVPALSEDVVGGLFAVALTAAVSVGLVAWGQLTKARRELMASLRQRAERAEAEQHLRSEHARQAERTRIAREMHDVVAHRVSLVALHAGALEVTPDAPPAAVEHAATLIRATARQALEELREVIGVLRDDGAAAPQAPQPGLGTIARLVAESRTAGAKIRLTTDVDRLDEAPGPLGRDAYRIVQEALTNVSRHATAAATDVHLSGGPGRGLRVVVRNRLPLHPAPTDLPGAGRGLVGLVERAEIGGGCLRHGADGRGDFVVEAHLVWSP